MKHTMKHKYDSFSIKQFMAGLERRNPHEVEFHQSVYEVAQSVIPYIRKFPDKYKDSIIFERITEPERIYIFRILWEDDNGNIRVNRGYRVQFNNALGPYKGGLRFHPSVNLGVLKFLAFEQTFKNALTTLPLGAAKGGSDFNPRGKSDREILRFCKSFMLALFQHIGPNIDVPAGDIGVGEREIGYLFGQYKRITGEFASGVLTGKTLASGGSLIRKEATGYGAVYFAVEMLSHHNEEIANKTCVVSGSGNVAQYCAEKIINLGGKVVTMSDSDGYIYDKDGIDAEKLAFIINLKTVQRGRIAEYVKQYKTAKYIANKRVWEVPCDIAFPCATQNEINLDDAKKLLKNKCIAVVEGSNMPTTEDAMALLRDNILFAPAKAANAGGVAISGLEMSQNSLRLSWGMAEMESRLHGIMCNIHQQCVDHSKKRNKRVDYIDGSNIAGFVKVADAMLSQGV